MGRRPGVYDELISIGLARELAALERSGFLIQKESVDPADAHVRLSAFSSLLLQRALRDQKGDNALANQLETCRRVLVELQRLSTAVVEDDDFPQAPPEILLAISRHLPGIGRDRLPKRPALSLSEGDLLINAAGEPGFGHLLEDEVPSSDRIDLICAFIRWSGIRILEAPLREFLSAGRSFRVLTTVYTGSTEREALDRLVEMGAEIKVSYDTASTRLHAKAWLFHRESGFSTAYVGSSNLSHSALVVGQEWNVRLSEVQTPAVLSKFRASFESYWAKPVFETYRPGVDAARFDEAIQRGRGNTTVTFVGIDVIPKDHQVEMLQALQTERERHGHHRNLLVAATGTGKTYVAALDYRRLCRDVVRPPLLFVAHRKEILEQSLHVFRAVLRDGSFGELYVDGRRPEEGRHVFASIQSLSQRSLEDIAPNYFRVVIVDEFHHAAATTYRRLLDHLQPDELLGLTATPERTDTLDILGRFEGRLAFELRLWEALEEGILCPFQYFGIHDDVDLSGVAWTHGRYDDSALENLYTANDYRVRLILEEIRKRISEPLPHACSRLLRNGAARRVHGEEVLGTWPSCPCGHRKHGQRRARCGAPEAHRARGERPVLGRPLQRRLRPPGDRHGAFPPANGERNRLLAAARPWTAPIRREGVLDGTRLHRQGESSLSLRAALSGSHRGFAFPAQGTDQPALSFAALRLLDPARPRC